MNPAASLRALLVNSIDYAGLFPPANLPLEESLRNYAAYVRDDDAWMLGAFVLPVGKFEETREWMKAFDVRHRLEVSTLGAKTENATQFLAALEAMALAMRNFEDFHGQAVAMTQVEMALPTQPGAYVGEASSALARLRGRTFWEAPADDAERTINFLASHGSELNTFGYKLRTGGVIASAFPSSIQIARALVAAVQQKVPIKFTAGLHHPVRQFHPNVQMKMHGFLNVLGAGVLAAEHEWDVQQTARLLEHEDAPDFVFTDEEFSWNTWSVSTERIAEHRKLVTSFGSCSFDEPREDLRNLNLL